MKKVMFAAALAAGLVTSAQCVESDVVGYQSLDVIAKGYRMLTPTFENVGNGQQFTFRDLKVNCPNPNWKWKTQKGGYWAGGISGGDFKVNFLSSSGMITNSYYWVLSRAGTETEYTESARWQKRVDNAYVDLTDDELDAKYEAGSGFWIYAAAANQLQPAGKVTTADLAAPAIAKGYVAVGNNTPRDLNLGQLSVTCPSPNWKWKTQKGGYWAGGISGGDYKVNFLSSSGMITNSVYWVLSRAGTETEYTESARWQKRVDSSYVDMTAAELEATKIPAGQALWIYAAASNLLNIPGVEL